MSVEMQKVESSNIESIGHADEKLYVNFKNGGRYLYKNVPHAIYQEILTAESVGKALIAKVKGQPALYPFQKV